MPETAIYSAVCAVQNFTCRAGKKHRRWLGKHSGCRGFEKLARHPAPHGQSPIYAWVMSTVSRPARNWNGWDGNSASLSQKWFGWNTTTGVISLRSNRNNNSLPACPPNFFRENNRLGDLADRLPLLPALLLQGRSSLFIQVQLALQNALGAIH